MLNSNEISKSVEEGPRSMALDLQAEVCGVAFSKA